MNGRRESRRVMQLPERNMRWVLQYAHPAFKHDHYLHYYYLLNT